MDCENDISQVAHAIEAHSYSAGIEPKSIEAKVLQDADRLDAIGFIGVARCWYLAGSFSTSIHHPTDPASDTRAQDVAAYALDHFQTNLLGLGTDMCTATGKQLAKERSERPKLFFSGILDEVQ